MSASAFTATVAGCPGAGGMVDQTADPRLTTGFCGLSGEAISMAALAALGNVPFSASGAGLAGCCPFCAVDWLACGSLAAGGSRVVSRRRRLRALGDFGRRLRRSLLLRLRRGDREVLRLLAHHNRGPRDGEHDAEHDRKRKPKPGPASLRERTGRLRTFRVEPRRSTQSIVADRHFGRRAEFRPVLDSRRLRAERLDPPAGASADGTTFARLDDAGLEPSVFAVTLGAATLAVSPGCDARSARTGGAFVAAAP